MNHEIKQRIEDIKRGAVPEGYKKMRIIGIVPIEWQEGPLSEVLHHETRPVPKPTNAYWRLGLRSHAKGTFHELIKDPHTINMKELYEVRKNDLIVNITFAWEHAVAIADKEDEGKLVSHRFPTYIFNQGCVPQFFKYVVMQSWFRKMLENISPGGAGRNRVMSKTAFLKLPCYIPPLPEQEKIAEILSTWDKAIELKEKLITEKKKQKKWLLQNLLNPDSGVRLPGFEGEWKHTNLQDCALNKGEYGLNAPACEYRAGLPRYIRITDIDEKGRYISSNKAYVDSDNSFQYFLKSNDLLFVRTGATVGKTYLYNEKDGHLIFAGFLIRFSIDYTKCNPIFIKNIFNTVLYWKWVKKISARSGQPGINAAEYGKYGFSIPNSLEEQTAIANIFSTADKEIDLLERELDQLQKQKKALMQLLLTGIVRVNTISHEAIRR